MRSRSSTAAIGLSVSATGADASGVVDEVVRAEADVGTGAPPKVRVNSPGAHANAHAKNIGPQKLRSTPFVSSNNGKSQLSIRFTTPKINPRKSPTRSALFKYFQQKIGRAVENFRVFAKSRSAVYVAFETHDAADSLEIAASG